MSPRVLFVVGILIAFGLLIVLATALGPVFAGVAIARLGVAIFTLGLILLVLARERRCEFSRAFVPPTTCG